MTRLITRLIAIIATTVLILSCDHRPHYRKCEGSIWATTYHITYRSDRSLDDSIIHIFQAVEQSLSPFSKNSTVSRINRNETSLCDSLFTHIFSASQTIARNSHGAFDPTVAPLVNLWGFGYRKNRNTPSASAVDSALAYVGIDSCGILGGHIHKKSPHTEFDFSAITKGYACDLIGNMLLRNGCTSFLVEIGGEVTVSGLSPQNEPWHIMIDAPVESDTTVIHKNMAVISATDCGIATSGNYRNYRTTDAGKIWHTISPYDGRPVHTTTLSATVIAPDAMTADAYATACMAMPTEQALDMIKCNPKLEALLVTADSSGLVLHTTPGFPAVK